MIAISTVRRNMIQDGAALSLALALAAAGCGDVAGATDDDAPAAVREAVAGPTLPAGFAVTKLGTVNGAVGATYDPANGAWSVTGGGVGLFATTGKAGADNTTFVNKSLAGDGEVTMRWGFIASTPNETRAMIRSQLNATSSYAALGLRAPATTVVNDESSRAAIGGVVTAGNRSDTFGGVKLVRRGNAVTGYVSYDSIAWQRASPPLALTLGGVGGAAFFGVEVASGSATGVSRVDFDEFQVGRLPLGLVAQDVGNPTPAGASGVDYDNDGGTITARGAGLGVKGTSDSFQFTYRTLAGDGRISARLAPPNGSTAGVRGGLMLRRSLAANASNAFLSMSNSDELLLNSRSVTGGAASAEQAFAGSFAGWVQLERQGNTVTASSSLDGRQWTTFRSVTLSDLGSTVDVGIAVTNGGGGALAQVDVDHFWFSPATYQN
jgi:hypothetical protein